MKEQQPYNGEQWNDLPLPDGHMAWQKMELLLDKEEKRRGLPFWWRFAGVALLLTGISVGGLLWLRGDGHKDERSTETSQQALEKLPTSNEESKNSGDAIKVERKNQSIENISADENPSSKETEQSTSEGEKHLSKRTVSNNNVVITAPSNAVTKKGQRKTKVKSPQGTKTLPPAIVVNNRVEKKAEVKQDDKTSLTVEDKSIPSSPADKDDMKEKQAASDSVKHVAAPPADNDSTKKQKAKKSSFVWSAGIGLQQAIAVNGQQSSSFNYNGKKAGLSDRLPSAYLRIKKGKWFAQLEFQYGVPQPISSFAFSQKTRFDAASLSINTERFIIQKLYYHQLPLSVNYHLLPNLSFGIGGMYNILAGAVTEKEIQSKNVQTGNEATARTLAPVKGFKDSFLYKTTAGILWQTDYHWKRFSLGLRYTQNLQPFIKYTKPDGTVLDEKTTALQAVLRFRLWQKP